MSWYTEIEETVFSYVVYKLNKKGINVFCTTEISKTSVDSNGNPTMFPTIYLHELQQVEVGQDLTNKSVNAVLSTIEVQVFTKSKDDNKKYSGEVAEIMKALNYNATGLPIVANTGEYYLGAARYRRVIGSADRNIVN